MVFAVGSNNGGQLGDGSDEDRRSTAVQMVSPIGSGNRHVAAGGQDTVILDKNGRVYAVGSNRKGQLGDGSTGDAVRTAVQMASVGADNVQVAAGWSTSLVLKGSGETYAVGENNQGQLSDGSTADRSTPVQMRQFSQEITGATSVAAGAYSSFVVAKSDVVPQLS